MHSLELMQLCMQILTWLHVSVKVPMPVYVCKTLQDLVTQTPDTGLRHQLGPVFDHLV